MSAAITLFDEPPRITFTKPEVVDGSRVGLLIGFVVQDRTLDGLTILEDGRVALCDASLFLIDWRYDPEKDDWSDIDRPKPDHEG